VQADAHRVDSEVAERCVFLAHAEVLACLRRVLAEPELDGRQLGTGQRAGDRAGAAQESVELGGELRFERAGRQDRRDLDSNLTGLHGTNVARAGATQPGAHRFLASR
jgi:hypothetical protein